jgi:uncharacterized PurR-regulated membrane protein YhhQ (DUF165 family)
VNRRTAYAFAAFVAVVIFTNWITAALGFVTWFGIAATAGTWFAGFAFVARDYLQESGGKRWVVAAILLGAVISAWFSPALAVASGVAFLLSELADFAVYTPLRKRGKTTAAIASNVVGSVVDSVLFLWLAGFPLSGTPTQVLVKVGTTTVFVLGVRLVVSRESVRTSGGGRDA